MIKIPFHRPSITAPEIAAVEAVLRAGPLTKGPRVEMLESRVAARLDVNYAVAVNSGTAALHLALLASREKKLVDFQKIIDDNPCIPDRHTDRGKTRLRNLAVARGTTYAEEADREFLEEGSLLYPHVQVDGNKWGWLVGEMYHYDYERNLRGFQPGEEKPKPLSPEETEIVAELNSAGEFASADSAGTASKEGQG